MNTTNLINEANEIIKVLLEELNKEESSKKFPLTNDQLKEAIVLVNNRKEMVLENKLPLKQYRYKYISHLINDSWPMGTDIGNRLVEFENHFINFKS